VHDLRPRARAVMSGCPAYLRTARHAARHRRGPPRQHGARPAHVGAGGEQAASPRETARGL